MWHGICMWHCNTHSSEDMEVISNLIKIRLKPKVLLNHYMLCVRWVSDWVCNGKRALWKMYMGLCLYKVFLNNRCGCGVFCVTFKCISLVWKSISNLLLLLNVGAAPPSSLFVLNTSEKNQNKAEMKSWLWYLCSSLAESCWMHTGITWARQLSLWFSMSFLMQEIPTTCRSCTLFFSTAQSKLQR